MNTPHLTDPELDQLTAEVDSQLEALRLSPQKATARGLMANPLETLPDATQQREVIEAATGQPFNSFWHRYLHNLRSDLCLPGGQLHEQWKRYRDLESKTIVRMSYPWIAAMGIPLASLNPVLIAASVFLLNVALNVGIETLCEDGKEKPRLEVPEGKVEP